MRRALTLLAMLLGLWARAAGARPDDAWPASLDAKVQQLARAFPGELSVYVQDVEGGTQYAYRADEPTYLSSTLKVVVALELLRRVDAGLVSLDEVHVFGPDDVRDGVGPKSRSPPGTRFTLGGLLELMLVHSDNAAADVLIGYLGTHALEEHLAGRDVRFGPLRSLLDERRAIYGTLDPRAEHLTPRQVSDLGRYDSLEERARALSALFGHAPPWDGRALAQAFEAFYTSGINSAPMRQMGRLLAQVARCDGLTRTSCEQLLGMMRACRTGAHRLKAGFPEGTPWAHKTGTQHRRACDVGLVFVGPERAVVVAACARGFPRVSDAEAAFAQLGRAVWDSLVPPMAQGTGGSGLRPAVTLPERLLEVPERTLPP